MEKEYRKEVDKLWGEEIWLVNDEYCGKLLILNPGIVCSYHCHNTKKETFYCLEGHACLTIEGKDYMMTPFARPKTIQPREKHSFHSLRGATLLEISTHHDEEDVVRITESQSGME